MKKPPTLPIVLGLLALFCFRMASAWQTTSKQEDTSKAPSLKASDVTLAKENSPEAVELVQQARNRLYERPSVQAEMTEVVSVGDYTFRSSGAYFASTGFRYRLEYQARLGDLQGSFLEVCDGQVLHTRRQIGEADPALTSTDVPEIEVSRRDIQKIRREALAIKETTSGGELADALRAAEMGIGGLSAVLASLERSMVFDGVRPETIDGRNYLVVQGHWRSDRRERLFTGLGGAANQIAGFLPDLVQVYFAKETLFPEKFLYLKFASEEKKSYVPMVTVEFRNVVLDQAVPDRQFVFVAPPGVEEKDETAVYIESMRQTAEPAAETPKK